MERVVALDRLGFDEAWFGEHHSGGYELIACPEVFIAAAAERTARKELQRLERQLDRLTAREAGLSAELAANATDYEKLTALGAELKAAQAEKADLEERWLTVAAELDA